MKKNKILRKSLQIESVNNTIDFIDKKRNKSLGLFSSKGDYTEYCTVIDFLYEYKNILNNKLKKMKTKEKTTSKQLFGRTFQLTKSKEIALEITEMMFGKKAANKALKKFEETFIPKN